MQNQSIGVEIILPSSQRSNLRCTQGWQQYYDPEMDTTYFYHKKSGLAQWTCPKSQTQQQQLFRKSSKK